MSSRRKSSPNGPSTYRPTKRRSARPSLRAATPRKPASAISMLDEELEEVVTMGEEHWILARGELVARPRQPDIDRLGDAAGIGRERHDAIAAIDRLLE